MTTKNVIVAMAFLALSLPVVAQAQDLNDPTDPASQGIQEKAKKDKIKQTITITGVISSQVGQGTFVNIDDSQTTGISNNPTGTDTSNAFDFASMGYSLVPSYGIGQIIFATRIAMSQFIAGGRFDTNEPGQIRFADLPLNMAWTGTTLPGGVRFNVQGGLQFPTSQLSQTATLITGTSVTLGFSRTFLNSITLIGTFSGTKDFHRSKSPAVDPDEVGFENVLFREGEELSRGALSPSSNPLIVINGVNTEFIATPALTLAWRVGGLVTIAATYGVATFWSYNRDNDDEFTPTITDSFGEGVADTGRGIGQLQFGSVRAAFRLPVDIPHLNRIQWAIGISTLQPPKTDDNRSFNFPFWNFNGAASNRSTVGFSAAYNWSTLL
jgi:hypothetical protein